MTQYVIGNGAQDAADSVQATATHDDKIVLVIVCGIQDCVLRLAGCDGDLDLAWAFVQHSCNLIADFHLQLIAVCQVLIGCLVDVAGADARHTSSNGEGYVLLVGSVSYEQDGELCLWIVGYQLDGGLESANSVVGLVVRYENVLVNHGSPFPGFWIARDMREYLLELTIEQAKTAGNRLQPVN